MQYIITVYHSMILYYSIIRQSAGQPQPSKTDYQRVATKNLTKNIQQGLQPQPLGARRVRGGDRHHGGGPISKESCCRTPAVKNPSVRLQ